VFDNIGFIGCGNMGGAMARAVRKADREARLFFANRSPDKAQALAEELDGQVQTNEWVAEHCDLIFLGVKPQMMAQVLSPLSPALSARRDRVVLLSMAAALTTETIREMAGGDCPVARIMPNTPSAIGAGVVQLCTLGVTQEETRALKGLLTGAGLVDELDEGLIDAACAVSGCGPAFAYLFLEGLVQGGMDCGLSEEKALLYAAKMLEGAARLALESHKDPAALRQAVCSPGGATIQGVHALERGGFRDVTVEAVKAAYRRTLELK